MASEADEVNQVLAGDTSSFTQEGQRLSQGIENIRINEHSDNDDDDEEEEEDEPV